MSKRGNVDGQLSKEEYDAMEQRSTPNEPKGPFARASEEQLKKRRIVRSANKWKSPAASSTPAAPSANVFSGIKLQASAATTTPSPSSNPFAKVSFASPAPTTAAVSSSKKSVSERGVTLNKQTLQFFKDYIKSNPRADLIQAANDYLGYYEEFAKEEYGEQPKPAAEKATPEASENASPFASTPGPSSTNKPFVGFSATKTIDTKPVSTPAASTSFSFGAPPSAASLSTPATLSTPTAPSPKTDKPEQEAKDNDGRVRDPNSEWEVRHEVRANYYKGDVKGALKSYGTGPLRLETSTETKKHRMVMRNEYGTVQLNLAIVKDMPFKKELIDGKQPGSKNALVSFIAKGAGDDKGKMYKLRVRPENLDALYDNLTKLASE